MKLLRVGQKGSEKPAALDKEGKIRDISSHIEDLNPDHVNFETILKLQNVDLSSLAELSSSERIGSCITKPGKFVAIGLNYSDHAAETGAEVPSEICFASFPITIPSSTSQSNFFEPDTISTSSLGPTIQLVAFINMIGSEGTSAPVSAAWSE